MPRTVRLSLSGHRFTDAEVRQGLRVNIVAGSLAMAFVALTMNIPLTMLLEALGASGIQMGLIVTGMQVAMVMQVPSAFFAERLPARKSFWAATALAHRVLWFVPGLLPLLFPDARAGVVWSIIAVAWLSAGLAHCSAAPWFSWMADLVPKRTSGRFWGTRQSVTMTASLIGMALAGIILDAFPDPESGGSFVGFAITFCLGTLLGMADIVVHLWVPEPAPSPHAPGRRLLSRVLAPFGDRRFLWLTICFGVWTFSLGMVGPFGAVYLKREFGVSYSHLSLLGIAASLGTVLAGLPLGYLIDRVGARTLGSILFVAAPLMGITWFFVSPNPVLLPWPGGQLTLPQPVVLLTLANIIAGGFYSGLGLVQIHLANQLAPKEGRTMAMAVHWSTIGVLAALGPVTGGAIMDYWTVHRPLSLMLPAGSEVAFMQVLVAGHWVLSFCLCLPLLRLVRTPGNLPVGMVLGMLRSGNPLRTVMSVYDMFTVSAASPSQRKAAAARSLGENKSQVAVGDLIERLDDPSSEVREAAVVALGKIGSRDALDALIAELDDPHSDLAPAVARALRESPDPRSVDVLMRKLSADEDRELRREGVRTLGRLGDPRAAPYILDLIRATDDAQILSASSEALASLGELAAIHEILPRLKTTQNPVLRDTLAVALGDLLGEPNGFYQVLTRERQEPGAEVQRMLRELTRAVRRAAPRNLHGEVAILEERARTVREAYEAESLQPCADAMFDLGLGLAALIHGLRVGPDAAAAIDSLLWRDEHFGIGAWYLALLKGNWDHETLGDRDQTDLLIGIYFLYGRIRNLNAMGTGKNAPEPGT